MLKKILLAAVAIAGLSSGAAQANLTINTSHDSGANNFESFFIQATSTGSADIFLNSTEVLLPSNPSLGLFPMDGLLSVWQQIGTNWTLVGTNDAAAFSSTTGINNYGVPVHQWVNTDPFAGLSDPGLTLNLTAGATYMIIDSNTGSGPTGAVGQTFAIGSNILNQLSPDILGYPNGFQVNPYTLNVIGNVVQTTGPAAVPLPAAVWLFGSALAGLGVIGRKKSAEGFIA